MKYSVYQFIYYQPTFICMWAKFARFSILAANISHQKPDLKYFSTLALSQILVAANQIIPDKFKKYSSGK